MADSDLSFCPFLSLSVPFCLFLSLSVSFCPFRLIASLPPLFVSIRLSPLHKQKWRHPKAPPINNIRVRGLLGVNLAILNIQSLLNIHHGLLSNGCDLL